MATNTLLMQAIEPGESLLWNGRPVSRTGEASTKVLAFFLGTAFSIGGLMLIISYFFGAEALGMEVDPNHATERDYLLRLGGGIASTIFGVIFLSAVVALRRRDRLTVYAITNRRVFALNLSLNSTKPVWECGRFFPLEFLKVKKTNSRHGHVFFFMSKHVGHDSSPEEHGIRGVRNPEMLMELIAAQRYAPGKPLDWPGARPKGPEDEEPDSKLALNG